MKRSNWDAMIIPSASNNKKIRIMICQCPNCQVVFKPKPCKQVKTKKSKAIDAEKGKRIINLCCSEFNVTPIKLLSKNKERDTVKSRHLAMYLLYKYAGGSLYNIGIFLNRHHAAVMHGRKMIENCLFTKDYIYEQVKKIEAIVALEYFNPLRKTA